MTTQLQNKTARYILRILESNPRIFKSWNVQEFNGDQFKGMDSLFLTVNTAKFKGDVIVSYNHNYDVFELYLLIDGVITDSVRFIEKNLIIDIIDRKIELTNDYDILTELVIKDFENDISKQAY